MSTTTGLIGEYITAAAILEQEGWQVSMAQQDDTDLVAWKDGVFMRVQVKASTLRSQADGRAPGYHFQTGSGGKKRIKRSSYDIYALCAATDRRVWFQAQCCINQLSLRKARGFFADPNLESDSWERAVQIVMECRK